MKKPVALSTGRTFATRRECHAYFRAMRAHYTSGERLQREDHQDLAALLERYPDCAEVISCGLSYFTVTVNEFGGPSFVIVRRDGTGALFSLTAYVTGRKPKILPWRDDEPEQAFVPRTPLRVDPPVPASNLFAKVRP